MKYFEIHDTPELKYAPRLKNWYGKFDVRDISLENYPNLPERQLFILESSEKVIFTDIVLFPFLLVSPIVLDVIRMYRECCFYREVILLDQAGGKSKLYYLPVFNSTSKLKIIEREYASGKYTTEDFKDIGNKVNIDKNIFWINDSLKRHTIISLDLAESLLRRKIVGLGIKEVELHMKEEDWR